MELAKQILSIIARFVVAAVVGFPIAVGVLLFIGIAIASTLDSQESGAFAMVMCLFVIPVGGIVASAMLGIVAATYEWNPYPWLLLIAIVFAVWHLQRPQPIDEEDWLSISPSMIAGEK